MTPREFREARDNFGLGRREFGSLLGYTGNGRNIWNTVQRYEMGTKVIPASIERLVRLLVWYKADFGYLPDLDRGCREPMEMPSEFAEN